MSGEGNSLFLKFLLKVDWEVKAVSYLPWNLRVVIKKNTITITEISTVAIVLRHKEEVDCCGSVKWCPPVFMNLLSHELYVCALLVRKHKGLKLFLCVTYLCFVSQYSFSK